MLFHFVTFIFVIIFTIAGGYQRSSIARLIKRTRCSSDFLGKNIIQFDGSYKMVSPRQKYSPLRSTLFEAMDDITSQGPFNVAYYD